MATTSLLPPGRAPRRSVQFSQSCITHAVPLHQRQLNPSLLPLRPANLKLSLAGISNSSLHHRPKPFQARCSGGVPDPIGQDQVKFENGKSFAEWDVWTAKFSAAANVPFLLLQMPQIILNARNLLARNKAALFAVPWLAMFTGLMGNLSLLSYFAKKKEKEAALVQTLGVISTYVVLSQLTIAEAMPLPIFTVTSFVIATGLLLNFMNYFGMLSDGIWRSWEDFITVLGVTVLPQVMWSTFVPYIPDSTLPGIVAFSAALVAVVMVSWKILVFSTLIYS